MDAGGSTEHHSSLIMLILKLISVYQRMAVFFAANQRPISNSAFILVIL